MDGILGTHVGPVYRGKKLSTCKSNDVILYSIQGRFQVLDEGPTLGFGSENEIIKCVKWARVAEVRVIQIYRKFANFARLYFPYFTRFRSVPRSKISLEYKLSIGRRPFFKERSNVTVLNYLKNVKQFRDLKNVRSLVWCIVKYNWRNSLPARSGVQPQTLETREYNHVAV